MLKANEELIRKLIFESKISRYRISKDTGIPDNTLSDIATRKTNIENMKFVTAAKLTEYAEKVIEEENKMNYGKTTFNNEVYELTNEAVFDNQRHGNQEEYYVADATKDGQEYQVYFLIIDGADEDASHACDWENASFVTEV